MKHGSGKYIYARHGEVISGIWEKGKLVGRVALKCSKFSFEGNWDTDGPIGDGKFKLPKVCQIGGYSREKRKSKQFFIFIYAQFEEHFYNESEAMIFHEEESLIWRADSFCLND